MEIIGEAVKKIPDEIRDGEPSIPWKQIAGMRDFLTHVYFSVNLERVWQAIDGSNLLDSKLAVTRIIAAIHFNRKKVYIREILTHKEYDRNKWRK